MAIDLYSLGVSIGGCAAAVYAGWQAWQAKHASQENHAAIQETSAATKTAQHETHETRIAVIGNGVLGDGLKDKLDRYMNDSSTSMMELRTHIDGLSSRLMRIENQASEHTKLDAAYFKEMGEKNVAALALITKLEHSSNRHSEQINILLEKMLGVEKPKP